MQPHYTLRWIGFTIVAGSFVAAAAMAEAPGSLDSEVAFNTHCRTCHSAKPGDNRLGPSLHGVMGQKAGSVEGFSYSPSFKTTSLVWDEASMDKFIANPNSVVPGSNMATFAGLPDADTRAAIIAYLKSLK